MSIVKTESWDILTQQHEAFIKKSKELGYPKWMIEMYQEPVPKQEQLKPEQHGLPF